MIYYCYFLHFNTFLSVSFLNLNFDNRLPNIINNVVAIYWIKTSEKGNRIINNPYPSKAQLLTFPLLISNANRLNITTTNGKKMKKTHPKFNIASPGRSVTSDRPSLPSNICPAITVTDSILFSNKLRGIKKINGFKKVKCVKSKFIKSADLYRDIKIFIFTVSNIALKT